MRRSAFYCLFRDELNLRDLAKSLHLAGARMGLPVVVKKAKSPKFWRWRVQPSGIAKLLRLENEPLACLVRLKLVRRTRA